MRYHVKYYSGVSENIKHLSPELKRLVTSGIDEISKNPYLGLPLDDELKGFRKYRVNRYRIVYEIHSEKKEIYIVRIDHRLTIYERLYEMLKKRL